MRPLLFAILFGTINFASAQTAEDYFQKAKDAFEAEAYKDVLGFVDAAIELDPLKADYYLFKASFLALAGFTQESLTVYNTALSRLPNEAILNTGRGNLLLLLEQYTPAIRDFSIAIELATADSIKYQALGQRGVAKLNIRDLDGAYRDLLQCLAYDSVDLAVLTNLANTCDELGKGSEAFNYLNKMIAIDSNYFPAYVNLGFYYQRIEEHELAIEVLNKALEISPKEPYAFSNRSYNKLKLGDIRGAKKDIETSLKLDPENSYAYKHRALIHLETGDREKACEDLQTALDKGFTSLYGEDVNELRKEHCR